MRFEINEGVINRKYVFPLGLGVTCLLLLLVAIVLNKNRSELPLTKGLFYSGEGKEWGHRINTSLKANEIFKKLPGVELDVFYNEIDNQFYVKHDEEKWDDVTLDSYFSGINNLLEVYFWLDLKNLGRKNVGVIEKSLDKLLSKYSLKERVIIESSRYSLLAELGSRGLFVSLWIPEFDYENNDSIFNRDKLNQYRSVLSENRFNAISAHAKMKPYFDDNFKNCTKHFWTNGMAGDELGKFLKECKIDTTVKIVLIDVE